MRARRRGETRAKDVSCSIRSVRRGVIIDGDARGMRRLTRARPVSLETALAEVPAELQRILTTIGELDQRNARLRDAVQAKTIPRMLAGRDVLVRAETGSGKTLSYIAPLFSRIGGILPRVTRNEGTRGLVLVPTRELATQVEDTARLVGRPFHWVVTSSIMGGENRGKEKARGADIDFMTGTGGNQKAEIGRASCRERV